MSHLPPKSGRTGEVTKAIRAVVIPPYVHDNGAEFEANQAPIEGPCGHMTEIMVYWDDLTRMQVRRLRCAKCSITYTRGAI